MWTEKEDSEENIQGQPVLAITVSSARLTRTK